VTISAIAITKALPSVAPTPVFPALSRHRNEIPRFAKVGIGLA
jgi:hypothetical protein